MTRDSSLDVAVVGVSGRFPGSPDIAAFWDSLVAGRVSTTRYERDQLTAVGVAANLVDDPDYVPVHGHLDDADRFDNALFRVTPREAELLDPQHRLMLEAVWTALEDAGCDPLAGDVVTGVFASMTGSGYMRSMLLRGPLDPATLDDVIHGTEPDFMASRIAYKLGLTGPAMAVQTACSSSLVAVHFAVQSLLNGDCDQAVVVAAGVAFPQAGYLHLPGGVQSSSGNCRPFDESADGVVGGSGVACVVLRRLADTAETAEPYGVIIGTATNNDGSAKIGYYAPSVAGQIAVIRDALDTAGVGAGTIGYLETHGTGTRIGDPIEWAAASTALREAGAGPGQVAIGATKANIGHLDAASGLVGLIKALLVVRSGVMPPVAGFTRANPLLETDGSPLHVPTLATPWTGPQPRRAGVSSFGIGGTNAHVVIEQAPTTGAEARSGAGPGEPPAVVLLSAGDADTLDRLATRLAGHLRDVQPDLAEVAHTLATGRAVLPERLAVVGRTPTEVANRLVDGAVAARGRVAGDAPGPLILLFPGQGTQQPGMALPYHRVLPGFPAALESCLDAFGGASADRLRRALLDPGFPADELDRTDLAQPALFALGYAAATALSALGLRPAALVGHSLGEITAACVGGALDLSDAARLVSVRGAAMQACPPGAMMALGCTEAEALKLVENAGSALELAAVNSPDNCVVAGPVEAVEAFQVWLDDRVFARRLRTVRAFHTSLVEASTAALTDVLSTVRFRPVTAPLATNVDGDVLPAGAVLPAEMFVAQARSPVRFAAAMAGLASRFPGAVVLEVGPGRALSGSAEASGLATLALSPGRSPRPDEETLAALGALWVTGQPVAPASLCGGGRPVRLPSYPFRGPRWIAPEAAAALSPVDATAAALSPVDATAAAPPHPEPAVTTAPVDVSVLLPKLWSDLLGSPDVTEDSDFFALGGDSLLLTRLARRIREQLGVRVPLREMLAGRTLGRHIAIVDDLVRDHVPSRS
jgi:acyl transferase domain-containing protein/acyl carrier protein